MKNFLLCISFALTLSGCVSFKNPIPIGYTGETVTISDTFSNHEGSTAHFYVVNKVNGLDIEDSGYKTRVENHGRGFNMTPSIASREIAAIEQTITITIAGFVQFATDGQAMFMDDLLVSGNITFLPQLNETYKVNGKLSKMGSSVWIENSKGEVVSEVINAHAKKN